MITTRLGSTNRTVSRIALGTWQLGGDWGSLEEREAERVIAQALDVGINLFDTAPSYGGGKSEQMLGHALRDRLRSDRESVVIATKGGLDVSGAKPRRDLSRAWLRAEVERSLRLLGVDYIDVYQLHWPDPGVASSETAEVLHELLAEDRVRTVGVSNFTFDELSEFDGLLSVDVLQSEYNLLCRDIEAAVLPYCAEHDIGVLAYAPLAHGLLTGNLSEQSAFEPGDWRAGHRLFVGEAFAEMLAVVAALKGVAEELECSLSQLALAWTLANPAVHVALVGSKTGKHIVASAQAASIVLPGDVIDRVDRIVSTAAVFGGLTPENF